MTRSKALAVTAPDQREVDQAVRTIVGPSTLEEVARDLNAHMVLRMTGYAKFVIDNIADRMAVEFTGKH
jgi:hypothetical protein